MLNLHAVIYSLIQGGWLATPSTPPGSAPVGCMFFLCGQTGPLLAFPRDNLVVKCLIVALSVQALSVGIQGML